MLRHLAIRHVGLFENIELEMGPGLTVFTGETGAGKSLFVDALGLILGQNAKDELIQTGFDEAVVEGVFEIDPAKQSASLMEWSEGESQIIIRRSLSRSKPSLCKINGQAIPLRKLKSLAQSLITMTAQHEQVKLFEPVAQLALLDFFARNKLAEPMGDYRRIYDEWRAASDELASLETQDFQIEQRKEFLEFQLRDIDSQAFQSGEDTVLEDSRKAYKSLAKLKEWVDRIESQSDAAAQLLLENCGTATKLADIDPSYEWFYSAYEKMSLDLEEINQKLSEKSGHLSGLDEADIDEVEGRLDTIFKYKTKYHVNTLSDVLALHDRLSDELSSLVHANERGAALKDKVLALEMSLALQAKKVHQVRAEAGEALAKLIETHLTELHFMQPKFFVRLSVSEGFSVNGRESVEFHIVTNPGTPPQPLRKIVSGGELSRILLALKAVFLDQDTVPTIVFDEIDSGVGGITANKIGEKLKLISRESQVLCVTHLPQIATFSDQHVVMSKQVTDGVTRTQLKHLVAGEVTVELERMVGGKDLLEALREKMI